MRVGGELSNRKGLNRQGGGISAPALSDKDKEDIRFAEGLSPVAVEVDANGHACALKVAGEQNGRKVEATLPARTRLAMSSKMR